VTAFCGSEKTRLVRCFFSRNTKKIYKQLGKRKRDRDGEGGTHIYWLRRKSGEHQRRRRLLLKEEDAEEGKTAPWASRLLLLPLDLGPLLPPPDS
jgi:hypothetical protein